MGRTGLRRRVVSLAAATLVAVAASSPAVHGSAPDDKKVKGPSLSLKAGPPVSFSPSRITVTAELRGGADDDEELYCPSLEWEWGDGTTSEARQDCEPFDAAKSEITRRWTSSHTFTMAGNYRIFLRLKRGSKTIVGGNATVQVKPGVRDMSEFPQPD